MSELVHSPGIFSDARGGSSYINRANPGRTIVSTSARSAKDTPSSISSSPKAILSLKDILPSTQTTDNSISVGSDFADSRIQLREGAVDARSSQRAMIQQADTTRSGSPTEASEYQDIYAHEEGEDTVNPYEKKERIDPYERHNKIKTQSYNISSLSDEEVKMVREMQTRDREVRNHETAHLTAAGTLAKGGIRYEYEEGPDGRRYVVDGHVQIDTSPGATPEETIKKAKQLRAAAMASSDPSSADMNVASMAIRMEMEARAEMQNRQSEMLADSAGFSENATSRMVDIAIGGGGPVTARMESGDTSLASGPEHLNQYLESLQKAFEKSYSPTANTNLLGWG